jgi:hypothetical protein
MVDEETLHCERACTRLCHDFAAFVDSLQYDAFTSLFAIDGTFDRAGQRYEGRQAIREFLDMRSANRLTRHLCMNIRIDKTASGQASGTSVALMFQGTAGSETARSLATSTPVVVDYIDAYTLTPDGWKFKSRKAVIVFEP